MTALQVQKRRAVVVVIGQRVDQLESGVV